MPTPVTPLQDLAERIQQQEAELAKLRQDLQTRQSRVTELASLKEKLQAELQLIEVEMESIGQISAPRPTASTGPAPATKAPATTSAGKHTERVPLPQYLVNLVQEAKRPMTIKDLTDELVRRQFPTTSKDLRGMVQTRVADLLKQERLRRSDDQSGYLPGKASTQAKPVVKVASSKVQSSKPKAASAKPATVVKAAGSTNKQTLQEALTQVLAKSSRPLSTQELADKVLAAGYQSKSKDLKNVIWVGIGKMKNIERVKEGYRLKKGKAAASAKKG